MSVSRPSLKTRRVLGAPTSCRSNSVQLSPGSERDKGHKSTTVSWTMQLSATSELLGAVATRTAELDQYGNGEEDQAERDLESGHHRTGSTATFKSMGFTRNQWNKFHAPASAPKEPVA